MRARPRPLAPPHTHVHDLRRGPGEGHQLAKGGRLRRADDLGRRGGEQLGPARLEFSGRHLLAREEDGLAARGGRGGRGRGGRHCGGGVRGGGGGGLNGNGTRGNGGGGGGSKYFGGGMNVNGGGGGVTGDVSLSYPLGGNNTMGMGMGLGLGLHPSSPSPERDNRQQTDKGYLRMLRSLYLPVSPADEHGQLVDS